MGIFDVNDETIEKVTDDFLRAKVAKIRKEEIVAEILTPGLKPRCVITHFDEYECWTAHLLKAWNENNSPTRYSFADRIKNFLVSAEDGGYCSEHKNRRVVDLDCRDLKKGDAYGWMKTLSKQEDNLVIIIKNVTQIPDGGSAILDDKQYVEDILVRSWEETDINIDDIYINRKNLTIILTCPPEDKEKLMLYCKEFSYTWDDEDVLRRIIEDGELPFDISDEDALDILKKYNKEEFNYLIDYFDYKVKNNK